MNCPLLKITTWFGIWSPQLKNTSEPDMNESTDVRALRTWREGHHVFFLFIQMTTIELRRFLKAEAIRDYASANRHLELASLLMLGSSAAMRVAGDVDQRTYSTTVVASMIQRNPKFSGSDSPDHHELVETFRVVKSVAEHLPNQIRPSYIRFLSSVRTAVDAHVFVCAFHRGEERSSTGSGNGTKLSGVETLKRLGQYWFKLLTPMPPGNTQRCPFEGSQITTFKRL